jgi:hypothetical protein
VSKDKATEGLLDENGEIIVQAKTTEAIEIRRPTDLAMREEVDIQITTAKAYPRDVVACVADAIAIATMNQDVAESCIYAIDKGGEHITGPSVRLAEILVSCWGNIRAQAKVGAEEEFYVTGIGEVMDVQRNVAFRTEVRRSIRKRNGQRYGADMIATAANAASSIAFRNAAFRVVPKAVVDTVYEKARRAAIGTVKTLEERRARAMAKFAQLGVDAKRICEKLGVKAEAEITVEHLEVLYGTWNKIREGEASIDDAFPLATTADESRAAMEALTRGPVSVPAPAVPATEPSAPPAKPSNHERVMEIIQKLAGEYRRSGVDGRKTRGMAIEAIRAVCKKDTATWDESDFTQVIAEVDAEIARLANAGEQVAMNEEATP